MEKNLFFNISWRFILLVVTSLGFALVAFRMLDREIVFTIVIGSIIVGVQIYFLGQYILRIRKILVTFIDSVGIANSDGLQFRDRNPYLSELKSRLNELKTEVSLSRFEEKKQRSLLHHVVDEMDPGLICMNQDRMVVFSNKSARLLMQDKPFSRFEDIERENPMLASALKASEKASARIASLTEFKASVRCRQFVIGKEDYVLYSIQNIQPEVEAQETELWQKLIRVLTHEIMNGIGPILSLSKSLKGVENNSARMSEGLTAIEKTGEGLSHFIQEYQKLSTLPLPVMNEFYVSELFDQLKSLYSGEFRISNIVFEIFLEDLDLKLTGDQQQIEQVLINLIKNASESMKSMSEGIISLRGMNDAGSTVIQVEDSGPGIPAKIQDQVFIPFYSTKEEGSGIGLSLSRQIMNNHGGSIRFSSSQGERTLFTLRFDGV